jgi:dephospho-CoA kinase
LGILSWDKRDRLASTAVTNGLRLVGLTGGIGSGKSTVARLLAERGIPVIDADEISREAVAPGSAALLEIAATWADVIGADEQLDRRALGRKIFADPAARIQLERILHPRIIELSEARARMLAAAGHTLAFYEASLLVETGRYRELDGLVVVDAPEEARIARVVQRDDVSEADVRGRMAAQLPLADKLAVASFVIRNDGDLEHLRAQVAAMLAAFVAS